VRHQAAGDLDEQAISYGVPVRLVHTAGTVEVDEQESHQAGFPFCDLEQLTEPVGQQRAIDQPGQAVAQRDLRDPLTLVVSLSGVDHLHAETRRRRLTAHAGPFPANQGHCDLEPARPLVAVRRRSACHAEPSPVAMARHASATL
jgi:hypothetical protein